MKAALVIGLYFASFLIFALPASAKIWINEFSSSGADDWIELYNDTQTSVMLDQYRLRDNSSTNSLDLSGQIDPGGFKVFDWGGKLNNTGDTIKLISKSDESLTFDQIIYGDAADIAAPDSGQSAGRQTNGGSTLVLFTNPSKGTSNADAPIAPTATPIPENTPTPTREPTPTKVPTPTKIPTPTKSLAANSAEDDESDEDTSVSSSKKSQTKNSFINISGLPTPILGFATQSATPKLTLQVSQKPEKEVLVKSAISPPYFIIASGVVFITACAILIFQRRRRRNV